MVRERIKKARERFDENRSQLDTRKQMRRLTRRQRIGAIVLAAVAVCFLTLDLAGGSLSSAHGGVRGALGSLYRGTDSMLGPVRRFLQGIPRAGEDQSRLAALQDENTALRSKLARARLDRHTAARARPAAPRRAQRGLSDRRRPGCSPPARRAASTTR